MSWLVAEIRFSATSEGKPIQADDAQRVIGQVRADALFGTFSDLDDQFWRSRMERGPNELARAELKDNPAPGQFVFELAFAADLFSPPLGGAQHLFGILAGDLLQFTLPPIKMEAIEVTSLKGPDGWWKEHCDAFRRGANSIDEIRRAFKLEAGLPLLAFSFKPRTGFKLEVLEEITEQVLSNGFSLVELDTRFLPKDDQQVAALRAIASRVAGKNRTPLGRLSLNLSMPTDLVLREIEQLRNVIPDPLVVKLDGGLDGLSNIQAVSRGSNGRNRPIVTCYPLLRSTLSRFVPSSFYIEALAASGADIVYPGGRPNIGKMVRSLGGDAPLGEVDAVKKYNAIVRRRWPMPSIAGGIYAGQLHAFYELLGPDVAWFLGGGVALHPGGPAKGADLCVQVAREAAVLREKAGKNWADNLPLRLAQECEAAYKKRSALAPDELKYVSPKEQIANIPEVKPFWKQEW